MLTDPVHIAINGSNPACDFAVIRADGYGSERKDAGGIYSLVINHSVGKFGNRDYVKLVKTINATNPYTGLVSPQSASVSVSFSRPAFGFTVGDMSNLYIMRGDIFTAAGVTNILNLQS